jgi:signal transduction histidine kinase
MKERKSTKADLIQEVAVARKLSDAGAGNRLSVSPSTTITKTMTEECRENGNDRKATGRERRVGNRRAEPEGAYQGLRTLPSKLIEAHEDERKKIGGILHDSIGQTLVGLKYRIEAMRPLFSNLDHSSEALRMLEDFVSTLQLSIEEVRNIYMDLKPIVLYELGIIAALKWYCREFVKIHPNLHVELAVPCRENDIPEALRIVIFRITQEALNNVAEHSNAERVDVILDKNVHRIRLTVSDNGVGFNPDAFLANPYGRGLGLKRIRERAEIASGIVKVESRVGEGTRIDVSWHVKGQLTLPFPKRSRGNSSGGSRRAAISLRRNTGCPEP